MPAPTYRFFISIPLLVLFLLASTACSENSGGGDDDDDASDGDAPATVTGRLAFPINEADEEAYPALSGDLSNRFQVALDRETLSPAADGSFRFENLSAGEHLLSVTCNLTLSGGEDGCFLKPLEQTVSLAGGEEKDLGDVALEWGTGSLTITLPTGAWIFVDSGGNHSIWAYNNAVKERVMDRVFMESDTTLNLSTLLHGETYHHAIRIFDDPLTDDDHNGTLDDEQYGASFPYAFKNVPLGSYVLWTCPLVFAQANEELGADVQTSYFECSAVTSKNDAHVCASYSLDFSVDGVCQSKTVIPVKQLADESGETMIRVAFDYNGQTLELGEAWSFAEPEREMGRFLPLGFNQWEGGEPVFESMCKDDTMPDRR